MTICLTLSNGFLSKKVNGFMNRIPFLAWMLIFSSDDNVLASDTN